MNRHYVCRKLKVCLSLIISTILCLTTLTACTGTTYGTGGGVTKSIVSQGVYEDCGGKKSSASAKGKVTEIDGVEIKLPVDVGYAIRSGCAYNGMNFDGDDAARGIGIFNCNEEGDNSQEYADSYSINMRWEYCEYDLQTGKYPAHKNYKGTDSTGNYEVGGIDYGLVDTSIGRNVDGSKVQATSKARYIVYNPDTGKACVCAAGFNAVGDTTGENCNWGGNPCALLGGITTAVSEAVGAEQNKTVLEIYFADEDAELGPCEFSDGNVKSSSKKSSNKCKNSINLDLSDAANLAVSTSYYDKMPDYSGHEVIEVNTGSNGSSVCPTTELALEVREAACGDRMTADCGFWVASIVRTTMDKDYPAGGTGIQHSYCTSHSDKYEVVMDGVTYKEAYARADELQPGDILITLEGHTSMYVGSEAIQDQYDGVDEKFCLVGASQDQFGPKIQRMDWSTDARAYTIFRFVGEVDPVETDLLG